MVRPVLALGFMERGVERGQAEPVVAYTNAQLLVPASLVRRDLLAATSTLSAGIKLRRLRAAGETEASARVRFEPVRADILRLTERGAQLRHVGFEWFVLWTLAVAYFLLAWLAERRQGGLVRFHAPRPGGERR